jgi:hypothetical protein
VPACLLAHQALDAVRNRYRYRVPAHVASPMLRCVSSTYLPAWVCRATAPGDGMINREEFDIALRRLNVHPMQMKSATQRHI